MQNKNQTKIGMDEFLNAVNMLFHSNDKDMKVKANKFLLDFETKPESWDISYQVLLKDGLQEEAYYNALNILKSKIKYDFGNYSENPEYIERLLSFLESNIDKFKKAKNYILLNYCDCVGKAFLFTLALFSKFGINLFFVSCAFKSSFVIYLFCSFLLLLTICNLIDFPILLYSCKIFNVFILN